MKSSSSIVPRWAASSSATCRGSFSSTASFRASTGLLAQGTAFGFLGLGAAAITPVSSTAAAVYGSVGGGFGGPVLQKYCPIGDISAQYNSLNSFLNPTSPAGTHGSYVSIKGLQTRAAGNVPPIADGTGVTIGLMEFDAFQMSDVQNYLALLQAPPSMIDKPLRQIGGWRRANTRRRRERSAHGHRHGPDTGAECQNSGVRSPLRRPRRKLCFDVQRHDQRSGARHQQQLGIVRGSGLAGRSREHRHGASGRRRRRHQCLQRHRRFWKHLLGWEPRHHIRAG